VKRNPNSLRERAAPLISEIFSPGAELLVRICELSLRSASRQPIMDGSIYLLQLPLPCGYFVLLSIEPAQFRGSVSCAQKSVFFFI
jgi:hypothetical protein